MNKAKKVAVLEQLRAQSDAVSLPELLALLPPGFAERSVRRWLSELEDEGRVVKTGRKRGTRYQALTGSPQESLGTESGSTVRALGTPEPMRFSRTAQSATAGVSGFDAVRVRYREHRREAVAGIIANVAIDEALAERVRAAAAEVPAEDRQAYVEDLDEDLEALSPVRIAGLGISRRQLRDWLVARAEAANASARNRRESTDYVAVGHTPSTAMRHPSPTLPMQQANPLGFRYACPNWTSAQTPDRRRACFRVRKVLEGVVHDTVALEGNPFTLPEVKTLLDGVTVGGHRVEDERQVLNQAASWKALLAQVEDGAFVLDKATCCALHNLVAREEALAWGAFRTGDVTIAGTAYQPPSWERLDAIFETGRTALLAISSLHERAIATFLFGALRQFFYDGNKRTARLMMNGILLAAGEDAISVPAARRLQFNEAMIRFYDSRDGTEMMAFMAECSLDKTLRPTSATPGQSHRA